VSTLTVIPEVDRIARALAKLAAVDQVEAPEGAVEKWSGFVGYDGRFGFDDGYDFQATFVEYGFNPLPGYGDWPYWMFLSRTDGRGTWIAEYIEGDFRLTLWPDRNAARASLEGSEAQ
jgi:hypothetical protein